MAITVITAPATEPVSLTEAKLHLRVDATDEDTLITALIAAAREHVEAVTWRALVTQTLELTLDDWPVGSEIRLPRPPLASVTSVTYRLADGTTETLDSADYVVDTAPIPGRIVLADDATWPSEDLYPASPIRVRYVAGWTSAANVPARIRQAILLLIGHWFENREAVASGQGVASAPLPMAVDALLATLSVRANY